MSVTDTPGTEATRTDAYVRGVDCLLQGRSSEAVRLLTPVAAAGDPFARLALARACLELGDASGATAQLDVLLAEENKSSAVRSYQHLLAAAAAALAGHADEAAPHLDAVRSADARLEHAARTLRRCIAKGEPPVVRF